MIKRIGIAAREDLEKFFDTKVFLDLHVRVKSEWREDEGMLNDIGLRAGDIAVSTVRLLDAAAHHRRADSADLQAR